MEIYQNIIPKGNSCRSGETRTKKWIVIHETGNSASGANAKKHAEYLQNLANANNNSVSWHYTVDDSCAYHHIPDNEIAWHAGDGRKEGGGNMAGIAIEVCVNKDGNFEKAKDNAAWLTAKLLKENGFSIESVKQHHDFSDKNCPQTMRDTKTWDNFLSKVSYYLNPTPPKLYRVQVGAFSIKENANNLLNKLKSEGYSDAFITG